MAKLDETWSYGGLRRRRKRSAFCTLKGSGASSSVILSSMFGCVKILRCTRRPSRALAAKI